MSIHPSSEWLAVGGEDGKVSFLLTAVEKFGEKVATLQAHGSFILSMSFVRQPLLIGTTVFLTNRGRTESGWIALGCSLQYRHRHALRHPVSRFALVNTRFACSSHQCIACASHTRKATLKHCNSEHSSDKGSALDALALDHRFRRQPDQHLRPSLARLALARFTTTGTSTIVVVDTARPDFFLVLARVLDHVTIAPIERRGPLARQCVKRRARQSVGSAKPDDGDRDAPRPCERRLERRVGARIAPFDGHNNWERERRPGRVRTGHQGRLRRRKTRERRRRRPRSLVAW